MVKRQDVFHTMKITCHDLITLENLWNFLWNIMKQIFLILLIIQDMNIEIFVCNQNCWNSLFWLYFSAFLPYAFEVNTFPIYFREETFIRRKFHKSVEFFQRFVSFANFKNSHFAKVCSEFSIEFFKKVRDFVY